MTSISLCPFCRQRKNNPAINHENCERELRRKETEEALSIPMTRGDFLTLIGPNELVLNAFATRWNLDKTLIMEILNINIPSNDVS